MTDLLENNNCVNIVEAKRKLKLSYKEAWLVEICKLEIYSQIKNDISASSYIKANLSKSKRSIIAQLFCGCLGLEIETGRYLKVPRHERICKLCNVNIENKIHFLFECEKLLEHRLKLYHKVPELLIHSDLVK